MNKEWTFLTTPNMEKESKEVQVPKPIQKVLEEFKVVMLAKLPKRLPSRAKLIMP